MKKISLTSIALFIILIVFGQPNRAAQDSLRKLTDADFHNMLEQLHIDSLRPGANGSDPNAPNAANYDEAKANPYPILPEALRMNDGSPVKTSKDWFDRRRPEIEEMFDREVYGRLPKNIPSVQWKVVSETNEDVNGIPAITKKLVGHVDNSAYPAINVDIDLTLTTPANIKTPVPAIIELTFNFPAGFRMPAQPQADSTAPRPLSAKEQILARGWAYATLVPTSIQADNGAGLTQGIIGLMNKGQYRKPDDWGALRAWAWGVSKAIDYFETDKSVDATRVGLEGHSRYGKATLVAMAYEPRLAVAFVSSSGEGGAKLHRRRAGELLENMANSAAYHWLAGNFLKYSGPLTPNDLPVDSHELIAMCAPKPVFISAGEKGDGWVDARGMFMAAAAAGPVYKLLGKKDMGTTTFPKVETGLMEGEIAFRQHTAGHTPTPNWPTFLDFAARYFNKK